MISGASSLRLLAVKPSRPLRRRAARLGSLVCDDCSVAHSGFAGLRAARGDLRDRAPVTRPSRPRLLLFAFGDFAFNLFWQSIMLFLLFYYTDALNLAIAVAATTYL